MTDETLTTARALRKYHAPRSVHRPGQGPDAELARFWEKVRKSDGCWEWIAGKSVFGYGQFYRYGGALVVASRYSYELHNGPIPDGLFVCHHCDNPCCVRPYHLYAGDRFDNARDRKDRGCYVTPVRQPDLFCKKGHALTPENRRPIGRGCLTCYRADLEWRKPFRRVAFLRGAHV
jgi:hypothetical protein